MDCEVNQTKLFSKIHFVNLFIFKNYNTKHVTIASIPRKHCKIGVKPGKTFLNLSLICFSSHQRFPNSWKVNKNCWSNMAAIASLQNKTVIYTLTNINYWACYSINKKIPIKQKVLAQQLLVSIIYFGVNQTKFK